MQRLLLCLCLLLIIMLPLSACMHTTETPQELLTRFCTTYSNMPAGQTYLSSAAEWEEEYLSKALADSLFLEDNGENAFSLCRDYAIFLSSSFEGGEIAFFRCAGRDDAMRVAEMCTARIARVKQVKPGAAITENACVLHHGSYVILLLLPDNIQAREICKRIF